MAHFSDLIIVGEFLWQGRWHLTAPGMDCLGLAIETRRRILPNADPLPDFKEIYQQYNRDSLPPNLILELMESHSTTKRVDLPKVGDLAVIEGDRGMALGTFVGSTDGVKDGVILFGLEEKPILIPDCKLPNLIGYWRVRN